MGKKFPRPKRCAFENGAQWHLMFRNWLNCWIVFRFLVQHPCLIKWPTCTYGSPLHLRAGANPTRAAIVPSVAGCKDQLTVAAGALLRRRRRVGLSHAASSHDGRFWAVVRAKCPASSLLHHCCRAVMQQPRRMSSRDTMRPREAQRPAFSFALPVAGSELFRCFGVVLRFPCGSKIQGFRPIAPA